MKEVFFAMAARRFRVAFLPVLAGVLLLSSCQIFPSTPPNRELGLMFDHSSSHSELLVLDTDQVYQYLIRNVIQLEDGYTRAGFKFYVVIIGESGRPTVELIYLEPGEFWLFEKREERKEQIAAMLEQLRETLDKAVHAELDQRATYIHHSLCYVSQLMTESNFSTVDKEIFCWTDGVEENEQLSFTQWAQHPERFEKQFPEVSDQLNKQCQLPDLQGVQVHMLNSPGLGGTTFIMACERFWQYHLEKAGATFRVRSNLSY